MKLSDLLKTIEVKIPGTDIVIVMKEDVSWFDFTQAMKITDEDERGVFILSRIIESWNILGDDDNPLPVTPEIIKRLPMSIGSVLTSKANSLLESKLEKKKG